MKKTEQYTADPIPWTVAREALAESFPCPDNADRERWNRELDRWAAHVVNLHNRAGRP